jgi:hypothetical protein
MFKHNEIVLWSDSSDKNLLPLEVVFLQVLCKIGVGNVENNER